MKKTLIHNLIKIAVLTTIICFVLNTSAGLWLGLIAGFFFLQFAIKIILSIIYTFFWMGVVVVILVSIL